MEANGWAVLQVKSVYGGRLVSTKYVQAKITTKRITIAGRSYDRTTGRDVSRLSHRIYGGYRYRVLGYRFPSQAYVPIAEPVQA